MNVAGGFSGEFSFQYATPNSSITGSVTIYDGPNGTGNVLATQSLPGLSGTPLYNASSNPPVVLSFSGTGQSVRFLLRGGAADVDNISYSATQAPGLTSLSTSAGQLYPAFHPDVTSYTLIHVIADGRRLEDYGFSGWIGPEPHGSSPLNTGSSAGGGKRAAMRE
jgi:hypothetical protein